MILNTPDTDSYQNLPVAAINMFCGGGFKEGVTYHNTIPNNIESARKEL